MMKIMEGHVKLLFDVPNSEQDLMSVLLISEVDDEV